MNNQLLRYQTQYYITEESYKSKSEFRQNYLNYTNNEQLQQ